jgi:hypothetical protein
MTLSDAFSNLWRTLHELRESTMTLRLTACEDVPPGPETMQVEDICSTSIEVSGRVEEALEALSRAHGGEDSPEPGAVASALATAGPALDAAQAALRHATAFERLDELMRLAERRSPAWQGWARAAIAGMEDADAGTARAARELRACWQELAERQPSVSVRATGIERLSFTPADAPFTADWPATGGN